MNKSTRTLVTVFSACLLIGIFFGYLYRISPRHVIHLEEFQSTLNNKEVKAKSTMQRMSELIAENQHDALLDVTENNQDISYYIFEEDELVFWSDNHLDISGLNSSDFTDLHYVQLPNAHCAVLSHTENDLNFITLITIKYNYPYENDKLINRYATGFSVNQHINIAVGSDVDAYPVYCMKGHYLFSLVEPDIPLYDNSLAYISAIAYLLAFFFFFILYVRFPVFLKKKAISIKTFAVLFFSVGVVVCVLLYFNIPYALFENDFITSFDYASHNILSSLAHLTIFTWFIVFSVCLFFFHVKLPDKLQGNRYVLLLLLYPAYFVLLYVLLRSLIFHSSIQMNILHMNDFSFMGVWAHILILLWGIALALIFFKTHNYFIRKKLVQRVLVIDVMILSLLFLITLFIPSVRTKLFIVPYFLITAGYYLSYLLKEYKHNYVHLIIWCVVYAFFIVWNLLELNIEKNTCKYRVLAQNIYINGNLGNDPVADVMLEDLDNQLMSDAEFLRMIHEDEVLEETQDYLNKNYFRGFWNKYEMLLTRVDKNSPLYEEYMYYIENGNLLQGTHFYSIPTFQNAMTYIGIFQVNEYPETYYYFMEFYPRRQYKSYSFPDLLIPSYVNIQSHLNTSIAKYDNGSLTYSSGKIEYPLEDYWIVTDFDSDHKSILFENHWHYVYKPNNGNSYIVVSKQHRNELSSYLLFFLYLSLIYLVLTWFVIRSYRIGSKRDGFKIGFTSRFQYAFILLLIVSFVTIFYVSVDFIKRRYETQQIENLESKKNYIQKALQDLYFFNQELSEYNMSAMYFDLLELSYTYQTDIHVYDNDGVLIGSSLPLLFNRHLISNRISPIPYFSLNPNMERYENIGELDYLVAYADFYNGDYLQIGYIAIPLYFSQENLRLEIENYTSVVIHIYLIIIILSVVLTLFIGKRLSAPLNMLERKLKQMRIGQRNEKIDYKPNDEIGQLVAQYNRTVDELEQSAKLLAESERESAWRLMARQVAHEINNPLTPMKLSIQQLQRRKGMDDENFDAYFKQSTEMLIEQIDNLSRIASTFSNFARMPEAKYDYVNITSILLSVISLFANNTEKTEIKYIGTKSDIFIYADSEQLIQVFNNLIKNAIQSIPDKKQGLVTVDLYIDGENIHICVEDNGSGIPTDIQDKLFVPNFTTKSKGMGLGLAISKNIIQQLGGSITFKTEQNKGSIFIVQIPLKENM
ncbi:HAMP domain-containing protein [Paludibacteraceae bacterium OttesenSCG-928-F17]|nr:HAMP domain-containing protein [Paludibacteraceae bacterium OttesenSCG-928-F17]